MSRVNASLDHKRIRSLIWLVSALFVLLGFSLQSVAGSAYYSILMQPYTTVSSPPVILEEGNVTGASTIYAYNTSAKVSVAAPVVADPVWLSDWDRRVRITTDNNDVDSALSNFPVLVYLSNSSSGRNNDDVSFVFDELQSDANRKKIAVTTSDGTTQCFVEIEKWDDANEQAWLWVKVPSISNSSDTDLYLYYDKDHADNTDYVGDTGSTPAQNVWDTNFKGVYHLASGVEGTIATDIDYWSDTFSRLLVRTNDGDNTLHVFYAKGSGNTMSLWWKRSTDNGATWTDETQIGTSNGRASLATATIGPNGKDIHMSYCYHSSSSQHHWMFYRELSWNSTTEDWDIGSEETVHEGVAGDAPTADSSLVVDSGGVVHIVWTFSDGTYRLYYENNAAGNWAASPTTLAEDNNWIVGVVELDSDRNLHVVATYDNAIQWRKATYSSPSSWNWAASWTSLADGFTDAWSHVNTCMDADDRLHVAWGGYGTSYRPLSYKRKNADDSWEATKTIDSGNSHCYTQITAYGNRVYITATYNSGNGQVVYYKSTDAGDNFGSRTAITDTNYNYRFHSIISFYDARLAFEGAWRTGSSAPYTGKFVRIECDSTSNNKDGTPQGGINQNVDGKIDGGDQGDGSDDAIYVSDSGQILSPSALTFEIWVNIQPGWAQYDRIVDKKQTWDGTSGWHWELGGSEGATTFIGSGNTSAALSMGWSQGTMHYVVATVSGTTVTGYLDGSQADSGTIDSITSNNLDLRILQGDGYPGSRFLPAVIDEVRISNITRSAAWVTASYESERDHLVDFGSEDRNREDYVDNNTSNIDSSDPEDKGTHSNFTTQKYFDGIYDTLTEVDTSASDNNVASEIVTYGSTTGISGAQTIDGVTENMTEEGSYLTPPTLASHTSNEANAVTSISVNKPTGTSSGDLLIVVCTTDGTGSALTAPTGFSVLLGESQSGGQTTASWYREADGTEGASFSVSWSGGEDAVIGCFRITGWDNTDFPHASAPNTGTGQTVFPAVTTTKDNCLLLRFFGMDDDDDTEPIAGCPGDHTELYARASTSSFGECTGAACWRNWTTAGDTGTATWTHSSGEGWYSATIAIASPATGFQLDIEHVVNSIGHYQNYNLTTRAYRTASENFYLQLYNFTSSQWVNMSTITASSLTWYNTSFAKADFVNATNQARIRYWQGVDATQEILYVDYSGVYGWNATTSYELDLEVQWTSADYDETHEELAIYVDKGNTYSLDAAGGYMIVGDGTPDWGSTTGTISFWIKMDTSVQGRFWGQDGNMETRWSGTNLVLDWGADASMTSAYSFSADTWYFVAIVWDENNDNLFLYVGDENNAPTLDANSLSGTWTSTTPAPTENRFLNGHGANQPVIGHGDDLRYWDTDRTLAEIQSDYNTELTGSETNLRSYFKLNNNFDDIGPNNNDGSGSGSYSFSTDVPFPENIRVDVWNGTTWQNVFTDLTNGWNNVSVSSYLNSSTFTIRFKGSNETSDITQDSWNIDATLLHVWSGQPTYDYVLKVINQIPNNWTVNLQVYDSSNIERLSSLNISLHDGTSSNQIAVSGGNIVKSEGEPYNLPGGLGSTIYISMSNVQATATGTSYLYVHLKILVPNTSTYMLYVITFEIT